MQKKAKLLAALAAKSPLLLFAGRTATLAAVQTAHYTRHKCTACNTEIAFGAPVDGMAPFCPQCSEPMTSCGDQVVPVMPQEDQLTSVGCPTCSTQNVVEDRMADAMAGKISCSACGTAIAYMVNAAEDDDAIPDDDTLDREFNDGEDNGTDDPEDDDTVQQAGAGDPAADAADAVARGAKAAADAARSAGSTDDLGDLGDDDLDLDMTDVAPDDGDVEVKLDEDGQEARLLAFVDGVHTMTLAKADAGDNADLLVQTSFHQALQREAARSGYKALAGYGFKPVTLRVPLGRLVEKRVQAALAADKARVEASLRELSADYQQCVQIAAAALTHNFYRHRPDPLQAQLIASLEGMGVKQARKVVASAMLAAGPQYATALLELAEELLDKSVDTRNELSDTLSQINPAASTSGDFDADDETDEDDGLATTASLRDRLTAGVQPVRSAPVTAGAGSATSMGSQLRQLKNLTK
jgi:transcription elongation factor Elf1